jgi:ketosteroid isomerase-like protein
MSQENVDRARRAIESFDRRDLGAFLELVDPDVRFVGGGIVMEGNYHGPAGIRRFWENLFDVLPDFSVEVVEMRDLGDLTLGAARVHGHGAGSQTPFDQTAWGVAEWRDGKCVWWANYATEAEALEAVGRELG